jgi:hypothetical protein
MSHPDQLPRLVGQEVIGMRRIVAVVLGTGLAANGLVMLAVPAGWYDAVPSVPETGPLNPHFVRDISAAYFVAGAALAWFAIDRLARPAALVAAMFLAVHAVVHLCDAVAGREHAHQLIIDLPTVFLPPALAIWIVWPPLRGGATWSKGEVQ